MDSLAEIVAGRKDFERALELYLRIQIRPKARSSGRDASRNLDHTQGDLRIYRSQEKLEEAEKVQSAVKQRLEKKVRFKNTPRLTT